VAATVLVGLALWAFAIKTARGASPVTLIIIMIGASVFLRGATELVFDKQFHALPPISGDEPLRILGAAVLPQTLWCSAGRVSWWCSSVRS